jgi:hypothetical protein
MNFHKLGKATWKEKFDINEKKYQKWYSNLLWPPTLVAMKKYKNSRDVVNYFKRVYKDPRYMISLYDKLGQSTFDNWFTTQG